MTIVSPTLRRFLALLCDGAGTGRGIGAGTKGSACARVVPLVWLPIGASAASSFSRKLSSSAPARVPTLSKVRAPSSSDATVPTEFERPPWLWPRFWSAAVGTKREAGRERGLYSA
jgi:hypothetical protein